MTKKSILSKLLIISIILFAFVIYNVFWFMLVQSKYGGYTEKFVVVKHNSEYVLTKDDYTYFVKFPNYLQFSGNLCLSTPNEDFTLIIWPPLTGRTKYGIQIVSAMENSNQESYTEYNNIELNENREAKDSQFNDLLLENKGQIDILFGKLVEMWDIK